MPVVIDQRMAALALATEVRIWRKNLKADLKARRVLLADVLLSDATHLQSMKMRNLLLATPGIGKHKAARALRAQKMGHSVPLSRTSREHRGKLLDYLAQNHPSVKIGWEVRGA